MEIRTEIPEAKPTDPDLSDADATLEFVPRSHSMPVICTLEVTEADILEVHAAVAAMEAEDALKTEPTSALPPPTLPPKRAPAPKKKNLSRQWVLIAAAIGTWTFFVSLASLAAFGVRSILRAQSERVVTASIAVPLAAAQEGPKLARFIAEPVPPRVNAIDDSQTSSDESQTSSEESNRSSSRFGILRFAHATNGALVDGEPRRVTGDALFLSCGAHRIRTSRSGSRTVRVPCGKTVTL